MVKIGIDAGGTTLKLGVVENDLHIIFRDTRPTPHDPQLLTDLLRDMIVSAREKYPHAPAAVSTAGALDEEGYLDANQLGFQHQPVGPLLWEKLGEKIPIENDGICAITAELAVGSLKGCKNAIMITLGTGIGGGVIVNGRPYMGDHNYHAELGHMITHADGIPCSCGQSGCWECYASASALGKMAGNLSPKEVIDGVRQGKYQDIWQKYLLEVTQGLLSLCSIFHPEKIAIGGGLSNAGDIVIGSIKHTFENSPGFKNYYADVKIVPARFLNDAGILGAAALIQ